ncbi:MAG TPA: protoporphyrinogen oxidase [Frankiaceae bacterium]|nr:protoporphyrinogen oxidase [Frankiaceae bacterium]
MNAAGADRHVVVVGGGISGLAAAYAVRRALPAVRITVVEESPRLGGKLLTGELGGATVETGADNWLAKVPEATRLARRVGLGDALVAPATGQAWVWVDDRLRPLPTGTVRGVPARLWPLLRSRVLSPGGFARAALEPWLPGAPVTEPATVADVVSRRLGRQVVDRLVEPLLGGVYAGRADDLDLDAAAPDLAALAREHRSLVRAARARPPASDGPVFHSVAGGMTAFVDAVADAAGVEVLARTRAATVERLSGAFRVTLAGGRALIADGVVVAVPGKPAARLLELVTPAAAAPLRDLSYASVALVGLAYRRADLPPGSGILVPPGRRLVKAVTFYGQKWPHAATSGLTLLRASVGRAGEPVTLDDADLVAAVHAELAPLLKLAARPADAFVARWDDALPQYAVGHLDRVGTVEAAVEAVPGLAVAGAAYRGVGIAACVRSGEAAGARVAEHVRARG